MNELANSRFDNLKIELQNALGSKVKYSRDCKQLSKAITERTNRQLSTATLRRFFGILQTKSVPSNYTIDTLNIFIQKSQIIRTNSVGGKLEKIKEHCSKLIFESGGLNELLVNHLFTAGYNSNTFHDYSLYLIKKAVTENRPLFLIAYYKQNGLFLDSISIYHCLGRSLKEYPKFAKVFLPEFTKIENARLYFFE